MLPPPGLRRVGAARILTRIRGLSKAGRGLGCHARPARDHAGVTDVDALRALYDAEVRARPQASDPAYDLAWDGPVLRLTGPSARPHDNGVLFHRLEAGDEADAAIAAQVAHFRGLGHAFEWKHYEHDRPSDLTARLAAAGFVAEPAETLVVLDLERFEPPGRPLEGVTIREVGPRGLDGVLALNASVYGDPAGARWLVDSLAAEMTAAPDALRVWVAEAGGEAVSAGWLRTPEGTAFGSLWGGATRPGWLRRGLYSQLVAVRVAAAREAGRRWLAVDCSPDSLPILLRRGFERVATTTPWVWRP